MAGDDSAETKKGSSKNSNESKLKQKSPAEFFAENKNIAGFDNPGKSLYTTVRELVENALDSAESISELPEVEVTIEEIVKSKFNSMIGLIDRERVDTQLYDDYETEKAREKRLAKEARASEIQAKNLASGKKNKEPGVSKVLKTRGEASYYKVTCKDNGKGMPHDDISNMFGRVLSGTKYGLKQTRGKFGLGAKMALIWSKMSTGLPIEISSSMKSQNNVTFCRLDIDIHSIVSTKIPFKGTGKEYIGDDISEIATAVKSAIQQCCIQLKSKIVKRLQAREQQEQKRSLSRYIPDATRAVYDVLKQMTEEHTTKRKRYKEEDTVILDKVSERIITQETLKEKLAQHVEQVDYKMALEYATQSGVSEEPRENIYLQHLDPHNTNFIDLHSPTFVFRLIL